jgi:hypothetical protein
MYEYLAWDGAVMMPLHAFDCSWPFYRFFRYRTLEVHLLLLGFLDRYQSFLFLVTEVVDVKIFKDILGILREPLLFDDSIYILDAQGIKN